MCACVCTQQFRWSTGEKKGGRVREGERGRVGGRERGRGREGV